MTYTITQLCNEFGLTPRAVRFYEEKKLINPQRIGAGYASERVYSDKDRADLAFITLARQADVPLERIAEIMSGTTDRVERHNRLLSPIEERCADMQDAIANNRAALLSAMMYARP